MDQFILRIGCEPGRVARELVRREDIRSLALVTGPVDIIAELYVGTDDALHARLIDEIQAVDGVLRCETDLELHSYIDWSRQLLTGEDHVYSPAEPHECDDGHGPATWDDPQRPRPTNP
jgi:DNA-binding Lrp family transcriptional regulator